MASELLGVDAILTLLSSDEQKSSARPTVHDAAQCTIPIMTNIKPLLNGTEIVFAKVAAPEKPKPKFVRQQTWLVGATKEFRQELSKKFDKT